MEKTSKPFEPVVGTAIDVVTFRHNFKTYIMNQGKKESTANTMTGEVLAIEKKRGSDFWRIVALGESALREELLRTLEQYYPNQVRYLSGYMTSFRYFREYLQENKSFFGINIEPVQRKEGKRLPERRRGNEILKVTAEEIEAVHKKVLEDEGYGTDYQIIYDVLNRFPYNTEPEIVAMKIGLIDMTNSTHLGQHRNHVTLLELVQLICGIKDFDLRVQQGDPELVKILARSNGKRNLFSFASKYCTYHNVDVYGKDDYSIYDNVVADNLFRYVPGLSKTATAQWRQNVDYIAFLNCIEKLLDDNEIFIDFRRRKFDHFLWYTYRKKE